MGGLWRPCLLFFLALVVGCSAPPPREAALAPQLPLPPERKAITIALPSDINALITGAELVGRNALPSRYVHEFLNSYLTSINGEGGVVPSLAAELPSLDKGTWKVFDDGRMEVTWKLRRGVVWHDGQELTASDVRFGWEVYTNPASSLGARSPVRATDRIEIVDPHTFVLRWKMTSQQGNQLGERELDVLPHHLLEESYLADPAAFATHPFLTSPEEFVGSGPFRPTEWGRGTHLTAVAFDDYFMGRPHLDEVTFVFIADPRNAATNVLSGAVDVAYQSLGVEDARFVQQQWKSSGGGAVLLQPSNFRHMLPQLRPERASPMELRTLGVRRALAHALNREEMVEALGIDPDRIADSIAVPGTSVGDAVGRTLVRYQYDPGRALALLEADGWQRGADGRLAKAGRTFDLNVLAPSGDPQAIFPIMQRQYGEIGIALHFDPLVGQSPEETAHFPGLVFLGLPVNSLSFANRWHSRQIAGPPNRFAGSNLHGYANAATDRAIEQLQDALRPEEQQRFWAESWRLISEDTAVLPLYYYPSTYIVRKGMTGVLPHHPLGAPAYHVHLWDIDGIGVGRVTPVRSQ
jgi:peptide/nickel transport system substrate-binding protein